VEGNASVAADAFRYRRHAWRFSLDNILIVDGEVVGCIDVGQVGIADRYQDLATVELPPGEFDPSLQDRLLTQYGVTDLDQRKLQFHLMLDELF
jgi:aminoglycoside 3'-phosphotransferase-1